VASLPAPEQRTSVRRLLAWALVAALCVAAITASAAILTGDFDETDARVIGTSMGFAVFSATAASGASLRFRESDVLRGLGLATMALSAVSFVLLVMAIWNDSADDAWQVFGSAALAALACSHASLVGGAARPTDSETVRALGGTSITLAAADAFFGILAVSGAVEEVAEGFGQLMAVLVILLLLTTALPPILRRLQRSAAAPVSPVANLDQAAIPQPLVAEVLAAADRIDSLNADPGNRASDIRRECERLRRLARSHSR
jgi:hypothetical protein